jgi:biotin operon repressor
MSAPIPVRVRGTVFPSLKAAGDALGVSSAAIWLAIEEGREDTVGLHTKAKLWKPCTINGQTFVSRAAAAAALGVTGPAISTAISAGRGYVRPKAETAPPERQEQTEFAA